MPPSLNRLKRRSQFLRTASAGLKWVTPGVIVQARRRGTAKEDLPVGAGAGVGFTVSKKVGNAVERNRARRRLRAAAEDVVGRRGAAGFDYVLIGRKETLKRPFADLIGDLDQAISGIGRKAGKASADKPGGTRS